MDRSIETETQLMLYDIGFSNTTAYLIKFSPEKGKNSYDKDKVQNVKLQVVDY